MTKLAEDRADQLKRDSDKVALEIDARVRADLKKTGDFGRIHPLPRSGSDVPDDLDTRLVVLAPEHAYSKDKDNAAEVAARAILEARGTTPRLYRNTLVFLAADKVRLQDFDEAVRRYLAWTSIIAEKETLNLTPFQAKQAETQQKSADAAVTARLPETYQWVLVPEQKTPAGLVVWNVLKLSGTDYLAVRASKKLKADELFVATLGSTILRKHLDDVPLWRGDHVPIRQLVEDFASYLYLPRLAGPDVLVRASRDGVALLTWQTDSFAYAESRDDEGARYRGLRCGQVLTIGAEDSGVLVKPGVARVQLDAEMASRTEAGAGTATTSGRGVSPSVTSTTMTMTTKIGTGGTSTVSPDPAPVVRRYYGTVSLDPTRVGRDAGRIAEEVIAHLVPVPGAEVSVTMEIEVRLPNGVDAQVVRTVTENGNSLKFTSQGFERE